MAAKRKPKEPEEGAVTEPLIEYFGEGAEHVQFNINPQAKRYRVFANGRVLEDL